MVSGTYNFTLAVTDSTNTTVAKAFTAVVSPLNQQFTNLPLSGTTLIYNQAYTPPQPLLTLGGSPTAVC